MIRHGTGNDRRWLGRGMRVFFAGKVDLVRTDPERDPSLELHLRDAFSIDERSVPAVVGKEIVIPYPEYARVEPAYGRIGQQKISLPASSDPDLFQPETDLDGHSVRYRNGKDRRVFCRDHREPPQFFCTFSKRDAGILSNFSRGGIPFLPKKGTCFHFLNIR